MSSSRPDRAWADDLDIHEFMDSTKAACADRRHRLVLHSADLGVELARRAFPDRLDAGDIALRHVVEDLGAPYTLAEWLHGCDRRRWPMPFPRRLAAGRDAVIDRVTRHFGTACREGVEAVYDLLTLPALYLPEEPERTYGVLMNSFGPALARRLLGPPRTFGHGREETVLDFAEVAEVMILGLFNGIPDLGAVVRCCVDEPGRRDRPVRRL